MEKHHWRFWILLLSGILSSNQPSHGGEESEQRFVVMTFNTGTTLRLKHDGDPSDGYSSAEAEISDRWYGNGLSWRPAVAAVRQMIDHVDPDVVAFQEIFDCLECERIPVEKHPGFVCAGWSAGDANVARMVLGDEYQIAYHPGKRSKCLAVHRRFGALRGLQGGDGSDTLEGSPIAGCGSGARVARAIVERPSGQTITLISIHGTSGFKPQDQQCRRRQVERIFVDWGDGRPGVQGDHNLILGDFNTDPGRATAFDVSAARWNDFVGADQRFHFVSNVGSDAPRSYGGLADIDHIVSDAFQGDCQYIGLGAESPRVWDAVYFDHVPVVCTLSDRSQD